MPLVYLITGLAQVSSFKAVWLTNVLSVINISLD